MGAYRNLPTQYRHLRSFERYHPRPHTASPSPRLGVRTPRKTPIAISSGMGSATNIKFGQNNNSIHQNNSPLKILEKRESGRIQGLPKILGYPYYLRNGKATDFKFGQYIQRVHPNKSPLKISEKRERGRIQGLPNFSGTPYYLRNGESYGFQIWEVYSDGPSE